MGGERDSSWTPEREGILKRMFDDERSIREIGHALGITHTAVQRRIDKLGLCRAEKAPKRQPTGSHLLSFKRARRGFDVPPELELQYVDLLKAGVPIDEARRRLGIQK